LENAIKPFLRTGMDKSVAALGTNQNALTLRFKLRKGKLTYFVWDCRIDSSLN
jgi:hypothetical protein